MPKIPMPKVCFSIMVDGRIVRTDRIKRIDISFMPLGVLTARGKNIVQFTFEDDAYIAVKLPRVAKRAPDSIAAN